MKCNNIKMEEEKFITIKEGYKKLKEFLDKLNYEEYHFVNSNDICTPMDCVEEMVNFNILRESLVILEK